MQKFLWNKMIFGPLQRKVIFGCLISCFDFIYLFLISIQGTTSADWAWDPRVSTSTEASPIGWRRILQTGFQGKI